MLLLIPPGMGTSMRYFVIAFLVFGIFSSVAAAKSKVTRNTIAIMPFGSEGGFSKDKARILDELVIAEIVKYPGHQFITAKDIEGMLGF